LKETIRGKKNNLLITGSKENKQKKKQRKSNQITRKPLRDSWRQNDPIKEKKRSGKDGKKGA